MSGAGYEAQSSAPKTHRITDTHPLPI